MRTQNTISKVTLALSSLVAFVSSAFAHGNHQDHSLGFLPPNDLHLQDNVMFAANITEQEFNHIVDSIVNAYKPMAAKHGGTLKANKRWSDGTVNASANQFLWTWNVNMYGGLARRPEVTPDGFALVVCHELGHHLAGFPFVGNSGWAANEGQSDYFATQACARKVWEGQQLVNAEFEVLVSPVAKSQCDAAWNTIDDRNLCYRISVGGESLARLLAALKQETAPRYETPDRRVVSKTNDAHPAAQCRLDTYLQGGLCVRDFNAFTIPGRKHSKGQGSVEAETAAANNSCTVSGGFNIGLRPTCWFKSRM